MSCPVGGPCIYKGCERYGCGKTRPANVRPSPSDQPVNAARADEVHEEQHRRHSPAPAAPDKPSETFGEVNGLWCEPSEAPTPRTEDAVWHVNDSGPSDSLFVKADFARQLERELSAAIDRERMANMRADQAEEAAQSATRRSVLVEFATNYVAADKPVFEKWLNSEIEKEPYTPPVTAPGGAAAIASGSEREGE